MEPGKAKQFEKKSAPQTAALFPLQSHTRAAALLI